MKNLFDKPNNLLGRPKLNGIWLYPAKVKSELRKKKFDFDFFPGGQGHSQTKLSMIILVILGGSVGRMLQTI